MGGLRDGMTFREVERWLSRHGFSRVRQRGSHATWEDGCGRTVTVKATHRGERVPRNTIRMMRLEARGEQPYGWGGDSR